MLVPKSEKKVQNVVFGYFFNFLRTAEMILGFLQVVASFRKRWGVQLALKRLIPEFSPGKWVIG